MNELTFDELDLVAGGDGDGFSIADGAGIGGSLGGLFGLDAALSGGVAGIGESMAIAGALGSGIGMVAAAAGIAVVAAYRYFHQPGTKASYQP